MKPYNQTLYVVWGNQLLFLASILYIHQLFLIPVAILSMYLFGAFSEIGLHRYFSHKSFKTSNFKENLLTVFAFLAGQGAILSWTTVHRTHHRYADTSKDPHSPLYHPRWKIFTGLFPQNYDNNLVFDLMRSKKWNYYVFENKYYWLLWTAVWVASFAITPILFYIIVSGSALWFIATSIVNVVAHEKTVGTSDYPDAVATNSKLLNVLTAIGNHNNHHKFPASYTYSINGETDIYGYIIEKLFAKK